MHNRFLRQSALLLGLVMFIGICFVDAEGQTRRKRKQRRVVRPVVTNPVIVPPGSEENAEDRIISTVDDPATENSATEGSGTRKRSSAKTSNQPDMQQSINALSNQVNRLNDKLTQMQENDRSLIDLERLTRAEQRGESLRMQQVDVESKLLDLQVRLENIEYSLKPENIERSNAGFGSARPEEAREARRRQLEGEKVRVVAQIRILETSRLRLEQAAATADAEVDLLRRRLEQQRTPENAGSLPAEPPPAGPDRPE